ncbi:hypothetical protein ILYODFUR_035971 [Ilyodon furcidens]|uniref:Uncharacterized protein n=1 Tax=Ilyodon furcidens TaxID=33524 RepID=A0ABV0UF66_9TELE
MLQPISRSRVRISGHSTCSAMIAVLPFLLKLQYYTHTVLQKMRSSIATSQNIIEKFKKMFICIANDECMLKRAAWLFGMWYSFTSLFGNVCHRVEERETGLEADSNQYHSYRQTFIHR